MYKTLETFGPLTRATHHCFKKLEFPNMKFVLVIVAIMSLGGLTGCQPNAGRNVVTSDMGGSDGGSGSGY